jgi:hypothetical protein
MKLQAISKNSYAPPVNNDEGDRHNTMTGKITKFMKSYFRTIDLKGQSHKKVGKMRVEGDSLGPN